MHAITKHTLRAAASLTLGAATTVTIAWAFALKGVDTQPARWDQALVNITTGNSGFMFAPPEHGVGCTVLHMTPADIWELTNTSLKWGDGRTEIPSSRWTTSIPDGRHITPMTKRRVEYRFGWPVRAMWAASDASGGRMVRLSPPTHYWNWSSDAIYDWRLFRPPPAMPGVRRVYAVPTGLLPIGFTLNTTLYSAIFFGFFLTIPSLRRALRTRRNQCPHCGYSRSGLTSTTPCPECGAPINSK